MTCVGSVSNLCVLGGLLGWATVQGVDNSTFKPEKPKLLKLKSNFTEFLHFPPNIDERAADISWDAQVTDLQKDQMIDGNILALLYDSVVTVSPEAEATFVIVEMQKFDELPEIRFTETTIFLKTPKMFGGIMQSTVRSRQLRSNSTKEEALLFMTVTYSSCILVADRLTGYMQTLTTYCVDWNYVSMLGHTTIGNHKFPYPRDITEGNLVSPAGGVTRFYVTLPFRFTITLVDLLNSTLEHIRTCHHSATGDETCYKPEYVTWIFHDSLLVTTGQGIFQINSNRSMEFIVHPGSRFPTKKRKHSDGDLSSAIVSQPGRLVAVEGYQNVFAFVDHMLYSLRVIDLDEGTMQTLCKTSTYSERLIFEEEIPYCGMRQALSLLVEKANDDTWTVVVGTEASLYMSSIELEGRSIQKDHEVGSNVKNDSAGTECSRDSKLGMLFYGHQCEVSPEGTLLIAGPLILVLIIAIAVRLIHVKCSRDNSQTCEDNYNARSARSKTEEVDFDICEVVV